MSRVVPKKRLGQHFLVDPNILEVIGRLARLRPEDVVLEIGPGSGVLTTYLADRVQLVHAVEIDRSLDGALAAALGARENVLLTFGDALRIEPTELDPAPTKLVANLPYNVATPIVLESFERWPAIDSWCVMVQREVADRFFAEPSTKAYGAVSVVVRLNARKTGLHPVSRHVFRPPPNVESALLAFARVPGPPHPRELRRIVDAAFGYRRKTLANALAHAGVASRDEAVEALARIGRAAAVRAEELEPDEFVALRDALRR